MKNDFENNCVLITDEEWVEAIPQRMKNFGDFDPNY
jgi:hypothetical protein